MFNRERHELVSYNKFVEMYKELVENGYLKENDLMFKLSENKLFDLDLMLFTFVMLIFLDHGELTIEILKIIFPTVEEALDYFNILGYSCLDKYELNNTEVKIFFENIKLIESSMQELRNIKELISVEKFLKYFEKVNETLYKEFYEIHKVECEEFVKI